MINLKLDFDGGITILTGAADVGQGCTTIVAQVVVEVLGVDPARDPLDADASIEGVPRDPEAGVAAYRRIIHDNGVGADYVPVMAPAFCSLVDPPRSCTATR